MSALMAAAPSCPVCGRHASTIPLFEEHTPLSTQAWPSTAGAARSLPLLRHELVRCGGCGHVWNAAFDPTVPSGPIHMFNSGSSWKTFIEQQVVRLARVLPNEPRILEVGHGDGSFLEQLESAAPGATLLGVDPSPSPEARVPARIRHLLPDTDVGGWRPDLVVIRHVVEHLADPMGFLDEVIHASTVHCHPFWLYVEVPCFDVGLAHGRASDLIYEHCSHFTQHSFRTMWQRLDISDVTIDRGYGDEVIWALAEVKPDPKRLEVLRQTERFRAQVTRNDAQLRHMLQALAQVRTAIWGGTGKAALFIHRHGLDAKRFPIVVDSDPRKVSTYVPGTGQRIRSPHSIIDDPPEAILIATAWRAADIVAEVEALGLHQTRCLVVHDGRLCEWSTPTEPTRDVGTRSASPVLRPRRAGSGA